MSEIPQEIDHRYQVIEVVGKGFSGEVFRVKDGEKTLALKMLKAYAMGMNRAELISSFKFEFNLLKDLKHPNILSIADFGYDKKLRRFYFTSEWLEGQNFQDFSENKSFKDIEDLFLQGLAGLAYLHTQNILHGDLKSQNIIIIHPDNNPTLKLIDFGISHPAFAQKGGSPTTMSPEKILKENVDERSDLYAMAVIYYSLLAGKNPFQRENISKTLTSHLSFVPPPLVSVNPEVPPIWSKIIEKLLHKNPNNRYPSAAAVLRDLDREGLIKDQRLESHSLPGHWIGREESLKTLETFLDRVKETEKGPIVLELRGVQGCGKIRLLKELIYQAELSGVTFLENQDGENKNDLKILLKKSLEQSKDEVNELLKQGISVAGYNEDNEAKFSSDLAPCIKHTVRNLNSEEVDFFLQEVTHHKRIPKLLHSSIFDHTAGNPALLMNVIRSLMEDPLLCEHSGRWNLSTFEEAPPTVEQLGLTSQQLSDLHSEESQDPFIMWDLRVKQAETLTSEKKLDQAHSLLIELGENIPHPEGSKERFLRRAELLHIDGYIKIKTLNNKEARTSFTSALAILEEIGANNTVLGIKIRNYIAFLDLEEGNHEKSIKSFEETAALAKEMSIKMQYQIHNNDLGNAYLISNQLDKAIPRLKEEIELYSQLHDPSNELKAYYNLGEAYFRRNQYEEAKKYYQLCSDRSRENRAWEYLLRSYNGLGNVLNHLKLTVDALEYYGRAETLAEYLKDYLAASTIAQNRGVILCDDGRYDEALEDISRSQTYLKKIPKENIQCLYLKTKAILETGDLYRLKKDFGRAHNTLKEALALAGEHPINKVLLFYIYESQAKLALDRGDPDAFIALYDDLIEEADSEELRLQVKQLVARSPVDPRQKKSSPKKISQSMDASGLDSAYNTSQINALQALLNINRQLLLEEDIKNLAARILEFALELSEAESALIATLTEGEELKVLSSLNLKVNEALKTMSHNIAQKVLTTGHAITAHDALTDEEFNVHESVINLSLKSILCAPIKVRGKTLGILYLSHAHQKALFSKEKVKLIEAFADQIALALSNAQRISELKNLKDKLENNLDHAYHEIADLKSHLGKTKNHAPSDMIANSPKMNEVLHVIERISDTLLPIIIHGETGTGKELIAKKIHEKSSRKNEAFIAINCGAIPENLIESELFGYKAGAFTGANKDKKGLIEEAHQGTLFLDEVADLPSNLQVKLLRVLQENYIVRLGETHPRSVNIRVLAASHKNLSDQIKEGLFREDLFYRLAGIVIELPALRERKEDFIALLDFLLEKAKSELKIEKTIKVHKELLGKMMAYAWPGNIRELENFVRTALSFEERSLISLSTLPHFLSKKLETVVEDSKPNPIADTELVTGAKTGLEALFHQGWLWKDYEKSIYYSLLKRHQFEAGLVAHKLDVALATTYLKIKRYDLKDNKNPIPILPQYPDDLKIEDFKAWLINKVFEMNGKRPYKTAQSLGLNPGTIYRYLKN